MELISSFYQGLLAFASGHSYIMYAILFLWSILDVVPPFCFFTYGELFFIPWAMLASQGVLRIEVVLICAILGGILWDNISFWLWNKYGRTGLNKILSSKLVSKYLTKEKYIHYENILHSRGWVAIFIARFSGPLAWVTPFIAGATGFPYRSFFFWNTPGAIWWIGLFVVGWYFFGHSFPSLFLIAQEYMIIFLALLVVVLTYKYRKKIICFFSS